MSIKQRLDMARIDLTVLGHITHADTCRDALAHIDKYRQDRLVVADEIESLQRTIVDAMGALGEGNAEQAGRILREKFWGVDKTSLTEVTRLTQREIADTAAMRADPAFPVYVRALERVEQLMLTDPQIDTTEGQELCALVDLAEVYEQRWFPELCKGTPPK